MSNVYVVIQNDRHVDPDAEVFTTPEAAITYAREQAEEGSRTGEVEERQIDGWLYYAVYSVEGDSVWVIEKSLR